jgi:hypothetical protein
VTTSNSTQRLPTNTRGKTGPDSRTLPAGPAADQAAPVLALRPREAAKALGISPRLLWQLTHDGIVPCVRVGSDKRQTVLYPTAMLQAWLTRKAEGVMGGDHDTR